MRKRTRAAAAAEPHDAAVGPSAVENMSAQPAEKVSEEVDKLPLRFQQTLSWHAGKPIATGDLLKRLQSLARELEGFEQDVIDKATLTPVAHELAHSNLLRHKDRGVKAWTAHCLVDILRLAAPDAPFSRQQLKDIFTLFITNSIPLLADPSDPYHAQNSHVLNTLLMSKAVVLVTDIAGSSNLITSLFSNSFDILSQRTEALNKNLEYNLTGILQCIIEESEGLPDQAIETIIAQFLRADHQLIAPPNGISKAKKAGSKSDVDPNQTRLRLRLVPPSYGVAQILCNSSVERMSRYIAQYFNNIILSASGGMAMLTHAKSKHKRRGEEADVEDEQSLAPSKDDLEALDKSHRLIREMWKTCPGVLHSVVPQLEAELSADNVEIRKFATQTIGDMISGIGVEAYLPAAVLDPSTFPQLTLEVAPEDAAAGSNGVTNSHATQSFPQAYAATYQSFIGRRNDKSAEVRAVWTTGVGRILSTSAGGIGLNPQDQSDIIQHFSQMLVDADERVRVAAIQALALLDFRAFITKLGPAPSAPETHSLMSQLADRTKDRDPVVRAEASHFLGNLWGVGAHELLRTNQAVVALLGDIPTKILNGRYANKLEINALIDRVVFESLLPVGFPAQKKKARRAIGASEQPESDGQELSDQDADRIRVERLLVLFHNLDQRAKLALLSMMGMPTQLSSRVKQFLKICEEYNGGVMDKNKAETKSRLGKCIEFFSQLFPDAQKFMEDMWKLASKNDIRSYALIRFCIAEDSDYRKVHKAFKEFTKRLETLGLSACAPSLTCLLYKVSNLLYNKSHVGPILEIAHSKDHALSESAQAILKDLSDRAPGIFKTNGKELCTYIEENAPSATRSNDAGTPAALKTLVQFARRYPNDVPKDKTFLQALMRYALQASPPSTAKNAVTVIMLSTDKKEMHAKDILKACQRNFKHGSPHFVAKLAALSQVMLLCAKDMDEEEEIDPVLQIAISDVLSRNTPEDADAESEAFKTDSEAKEWALKIIANRLRSYPDAASIKDLEGPVYQVLNKLAQDSEEPDGGSKGPIEVAKARLRLRAALLLLKLCSHSDFDTLLTAKAFNSLMRIAQDPSFLVRNSFVTKVKKYLGQGRLSTRFYCVVFLLAFEPTKKLQAESAIWLRARATQFARAGRLSLEMCMARFISVLAHHPDFTEDPADLSEPVTYLLYYLQNVATIENVSLIYQTAQRVKTVEDAIEASKSNRLYYLSDVAVAVVNSYSSIQGWSLQAQPAKVGMPSGVFASIRDHARAQRIAATQHLSQDASEQVDPLVRAALRQKKRKADHEPEAGSKRRAVIQQGSGGNLARPKPVAARKPASAAEKKDAKLAQKWRGARAGAGAGAGGDDDDENDEDEDEHDGGSRSPRAARERTPQRKSSRAAAGRVSYAEAGDDDDDAEMAGWDGAEAVSPSGDKENREGVVMS